MLKIALVRHEDNGEKVLVLDTKDLLVKGRDLLERVARRNGVHQQETFSRTHVLLSHGTINIVQDGALDKSVREE